MIRKGRALRLLKYLESLHHTKFSYGRVFSKSCMNKAWAAFDNNTPYPCGTVGCVMGHAGAFFDLHRRRNREEDDLWDVAIEYLGLDQESATFLFLNECQFAKKSDAILRLRHLISGKPVSEYDWSRESYHSRGN